MYKSIVFVAALGLLVMACAKKEEPTNPNKVSSELERPYCNDPEAINYNYTFPGKPDNSICYYPTQIFKGKYLFMDSVYDGDNKLRSVQNVVIDLSATNNVDLTLSGFCGVDNPLKITADRYYKATLDSTVITKDGINYNLNGQLLCRSSDTISGYLLKNKTDSMRLTFSLTVAADSGYSYHRGTAIRQ